MFGRIKSLLRPAGAQASAPPAPQRERSTDLKSEGDGFGLMSEGNAFLAAGNLPDATRCFRAAIEADPGDAAAYLPLGYALREQGQVDAAILALETALSIDARAVDGHYLLALSLQDRGRLPDAIRHLQALLDLDPGVVDAYVRLCQLHAQSQNMAAAKAIVEKGLALHPEAADLHYLSGNLKLHQGELEAAVAAYRRALSINPGHSEAHYNCGIALQSANRVAEALESFDAALRARPDYAAARIGRGNVLRSLDRRAEALASYERAAQIKPIDDLDLLNNIGLMLRDLKRPVDALASFDRALQLKPDFAEALSNRGLILQELDRLDEALADYDRSLQIKSGLVDTHANRGNALQEMVRHEEALASYQRALEIRPDYEAIYLNESLSRLVLGDLPGGWPKYEWRWQNNSETPPARLYTEPMWRGTEPLDGKTLLLYAEQGLGDTIQFCRYAKAVSALGAKVLLSVQPPLAPLLQGLAGVERILVQGEAPPPFDYHCPLLSLPLAFGTSLESIPRPGAYIRPAGPGFAKRVEAWQTRLGPKDKPRIGLVWSGNAHHKNDRNRSIPLRDFATLVSAKASFVSLQNEAREADAAVLAQRGDIAWYGADLVDFAETAALIAQLDVVISVDTSVAHLAAAMGKPVWLLLPANPDWRWLLGRDDSPWYDAMRLFRQSRRGDWSDVLSRVGHEIGQLGS